MKDLANSKAVYEVYASIFAQPFSVPRKSVIFSALLAGEPWSWQVIGISQAALEALSKSDFRYLGGTVCRAHIVDRFSTAKAIFDLPVMLQQESLFDLLLKNGRTIITTKSENKSAPRLPTYLPIASSRGLFQNKLISYKHGRAERAFLRKLHQEFSRGKVSLVTLNDVEKAHNLLVLPPAVLQRSTL